MHGVAFFRFEDGHQRINQPSVDNALYVRMARFHEGIVDGRGCLCARHLVIGPEGSRDLLNALHRAEVKLGVAPCVSTAPWDSVCHGLLRRGSTHAGHVRPWWTTSPQRSRVALTHAGAVVSGMGYRAESDRAPPTVCVRT